MAAHGCQVMVHLALLMANSIVYFSSSSADNLDKCPKLASFVLGFFIFSIVSVGIMVVRSVIIFRDIQSPAKKFHSWVELALQVALIAGCAYAIAGVVYLAQASPDCKKTSLFGVSVANVVLLWSATCCCGICNALIITRESEYDAVPQQEPEEGDDAIAQEPL